MTKVMLFGSTVHKDATYKEIAKMLDRRGVEHVSFEHFIDPETDDNLIDQFIRKTGSVGEFCESDEPEPVPEAKPVNVPKEKCKILFGGERTQEELTKEEKQAEKKPLPKPKKPKKGPKVLAPAYILCFDDLGKDLRNKSISQLLIKNRHFKCKVIILSQWLAFLDQNARRQIDYCLMFGGFNDDKLEELHRELDLSDTYEEFLKAYKQATAEKYSFLYIDLTEGKYRKKFDVV